MCSVSMLESQLRSFRRGAFFITNYGHPYSHTTPRPVAVLFHGIQTVKEPPGISNFKMQCAVLSAKPALACSTWKRPSRRLVLAVASSSSDSKRVAASARVLRTCISSPMVPMEETFHVPHEIRTILNELNFISPSAEDWEGTPEESFGRYTSECCLACTRTQCPFISDIVYLGCCVNRFVSVSIYTCRCSTPPSVVAYVWIKQLVEMKYSIFGDIHGPSVLLRTYIVYTKTITFPNAPYNDIM